MTENVVKGYLDVKISSKGRRGFTPWRAWQRQWCEIRRLDDIEVGVEVKLKSSEDGNILNCVQVPRSATLCRTDSRTKQFAFGVFNLRKTKKPVIFLAGCSESDSQEWMISIRKMMSVANYIPVGDGNFRISFVDNCHSRAAGLLGLYGVLQANSQEIIISDPGTGVQKVGWRWYHFHQFHIQATNEQDDKKIIVMHTSREFPAGPGQLYVYCREGPKLLHYLVSRGQCARYSSGLMSSKRFSRSEGDLCESRASVLDSPLCFRSQTGSDDSGAPHSNISEENEFSIKSKTESNLVNLCMNEITKTPGGSETDESYPDLHLPFMEKGKRFGGGVIPRNESGISLASGIYEEIPDDHESKNQNHQDSLANLKHLSHVYEDPFELASDKNKLRKYLKPPPPLPPRTFNSFTLQRRRETPSSPPSPCKQRCNTLPAKDLSKISQIFSSTGGIHYVATSESEYVVMSPTKTVGNPKKIILENFYVPMTSPVIQLKNKIVEGVYMSMTGGTKKAT